MRTRFSLWYVVTYLFVTGSALVVAPATSLQFMHSAADYGDVMPRWTGMMSLALAALIAQTVRHRLKVLYPLGFFMPAAMLVGFAGLYRLSGDPLFLVVLGVVAIGVASTGITLWMDSRTSFRDHEARPKQ